MMTIHEGEEVRLLESEDVKHLKPASQPLDGAQRHHFLTSSLSYILTS